MNDGFSDGALEYGCDQKRGKERNQQDDGRNSRVALEPVRHLLQVGADVNHAGRLALKHASYRSYGLRTEMSPGGWEELGRWLTTV